jgi:hypothetical protein
MHLLKVVLGIKELAGRVEHLHQAYELWMVVKRDEPVEILTNRSMHFSAAVQQTNLLLLQEVTSKELIDPFITEYLRVLNGDTMHFKEDHVSARRAFDKILTRCLGKMNLV